MLKKMLKVEECDLNQRLCFNEEPWMQPLVQTLIRTLQAKDAYTHLHCIRVAHYAEKLAQAAGLDREEQTIAKWAGLFHDLGKIGIPDHILLKTTHLTSSEMAVMQSHPLKSIEILKPLLSYSWFNRLVPGILHHHERMDGQGYPDRLQGDDIPLIARIILIADTFDAMTTIRPYRKNLPEKEAERELKRASGMQFDQKLVQVFLKVHAQWPKGEDIAHEPI